MSRGQRHSQWVPLIHGGWRRSRPTVWERVLWTQLKVVALKLWFPEHFLFRDELQKPVTLPESDCKHNRFVYFPLCRRNQVRPHNHVSNHWTQICRLCHMDVALWLHLHKITDTRLEFYCLVRNLVRRFNILIPHFVFLCKWHNTMDIPCTILRSHGCSTFIRTQCISLSQYNPSSYLCIFHKIVPLPRLCSGFKCSILFHMKCSALLMLGRMFYNLCMEHIFHLSNHVSWCFNT